MSAYRIVIMVKVISSMMWHSMEPTFVSHCVRVQAHHMDYSIIVAVDHFLFHFFFFLFLRIPRNASIMHSSSIPMSFVFGNSLFNAFDLRPEQNINTLKAGRLNSMHSFCFFALCARALSFFLLHRCPAYFHSACEYIYSVQNRFVTLTWHKT